MSDANQTPYERLSDKLKSQSICWGDFALSSGARSKYYFDCKLTTLDPEGIYLVGGQMFDLIEREAANKAVRIEAVGGLTMGADPIAIAIGMTSWIRAPHAPLQVFIVRK